MEIRGISSSSLSIDAQPKALAPTRRVKEDKKAAKSELKSRGNERKPTGVKRASSWSPEVEEQYRLQQVGWRNLDEYVVEHGEPERWATNDFLKCLRVKKTGNYTYWREWRECEDKYLNRVKIFTY